MAQAQSQPGSGIISQTFTLLGDTAKGLFNIAKGTVNYSLSLVNRDAGVGAAIGLAVGAGVLAFAGVPAMLAGLGTAGALTLVGGCCGAGILAGGNVGKMRLAREHQHGRTPSQPSLFNKNAIMGFGLGAAGQALAIAVAPATGLLSVAIPLASTLLPVAGTFVGSRLGYNRMAREYSEYQSASAAQPQSKAQGPMQTRKNEFVNSVSPEEWRETSSLMRDSSNGPTHSAVDRVMNQRAQQQAAQEQSQPAQNN